MAARVAASRAGNPPHIVQVFEVGTATMMAAGKAIKPVYEVMAQAGEKFDPKAYIPAVAGYYSTPTGQMLSFPFNSSTPVFYYNKDAFKKAGLDPNQPPKTWPAVMAAAAKLKVSGEKCSYTTGWPSWVQFETFSAWHDLPFATKQNGFARHRSQARDQQPAAGQARRRTCMDWSKKGYFTYGGRTNEAEAKFFSGECAMLTSSLGRVRQHQAQRQVRVRHLRRFRTTPTSPARRRTRSSAAPRCG